MWPLTSKKQSTLAQIKLLERKIDDLKKQLSRPGGTPAQAAKCQKKIDDYKRQIALLKREL